MHQSHLEWLLKNRLPVPSPNPLQSELVSVWHAVSLVNAWEILMGRQYVTHCLDPPRWPGIGCDFLLHKGQP